MPLVLSDFEMMRKTLGASIEWSRKIEMMNMVKEDYLKGILRIAECWCGIKCVMMVL